jgi:hypothetical protein
MNASSFYSARSADLVVQEHGDELLVYDERTEVAHCLSPIAALVWRTCGDRTDLNRITEAVEAEHPHVDAVTMVALAIQELQEKALLEATPGTGLSRRQMMRRLASAGAAAASVPLVVSATIAVPQAAAYGTGGLHAPCTNSATDCQSGFTCQSGHCYTTGQTCGAGGVSPPSGTCPRAGTNPTCCSGNCQDNNGNKCLA